MQCGIINMKSNINIVARVASWVNFRASLGGRLGYKKKRLGYKKKTVLVGGGVSLSLSLGYTKKIKYNNSINFIV